MRVFTAIIVLLSLLPASLLSQDPADGISYQAVALDVHGRELINTDVAVRFSILEGAGRTLLYQETHDRKTDEHGLLSLVIGQGQFSEGMHNSLQKIDWGEESLFLRVEIDVAGKGSYRLMGEQQMMAVPFAMHAANATAYKMQAGSWHDAAEPVFQVTNSSGEVVFAVYEAGVEINVDDPGKGTRGGFAVGGFSSQKGGLLQEFLRVDPGYVRISIDDDPLKGTRGGFAVGGFSSHKGGLPDYFSLWPDRAEFMLEQEVSKGTRGGFAVGGFSSQKGYQQDEYLFAAHDSVRFFIDDSDDKGTRGGFAVGGFSSRKQGEEIDFMRIEPGFLRLAIEQPDDAKGTRGGFAVGGFSSRKSDLPDYFSLTPGLASFTLDLDGAKGTRGGFAVGGFSSHKGDLFSDYLHVTHDSVRVGLNAMGKGVRGGFAVGGMSGRKGIYQDILYTTPELTEIYTRDSEGKFLGGFTVFGLDEFFQGTDLFQVTSLETRVTTVFAVVPTVRTSEEVTGITAYSAAAGGEVVSDGDADIIRRGLAWSLRERPRVDTDYSEWTEEIIADGFDGLGSFTGELENLLPGRQYYVRAYAENKAGAGYGTARSFWTNNIITVASQGDGFVEPDGSFELVRGESMTFNFYPNYEAEQEIRDVLLNGVSVLNQVTIGEGGMGTYTFANNVAGEQELEVIFGVPFDYPEFDAITRQFIAGFPLSDEEIDGSDNENNMIPDGTIVLYRTNEGRYGKFFVREYGFNLDIVYVTYNEDGTVYSSGEVTVPGTFNLDLDLGLIDPEPPHLVDFWWQQSTEIIRSIAPKNGALFGVLTDEVPPGPVTSRSYTEDFRFHDEQGWAVLGYDVFAYVEAEVNEMLIYGDHGRATLLTPLGATRDDFSFTMYPGTIYEGVERTGFGRMGFKSMLAIIIEDGDVNIVFTEDIADYAEPELTVLASVPVPDPVSSFRLDMERQSGNNMLVSAYVDDNMIYSDVITGVDEGLFSGQMFILAQGDPVHESFAVSIDGIEIAYNDYIEEYGLFDDDFTDSNTPWIRDGNYDVIGQSITISDGQLNFNYTGFNEYIELIAISPAGPVTDFSIELSGDLLGAGNSDLAVSRLASYGNYITAFITGNNLYIGYEHHYEGFSTVGFAEIDSEAIDTIKFYIRYNAGDLDVYVWINNQMVMHEVIEGAPYELLSGHIVISYSGEEEIEINAYIDNAVIRYGDHLEEVIIDPHPGVTDIDGNFYPIVEIGEQLWMGENLITTRFRDGSEISNPPSWDWGYEYGVPEYIAYDHEEVEGIGSEEEMVEYYGLLYNSQVVMDERGICPAGWYVPTAHDWDDLVDHLGGEEIAGGKLKSARTEPDPHPRWDEPNIGDVGQSEFEALPGGTINYGFWGLGTNGSWWTSSTVDDLDDFFYWKGKGDDEDASGKDNDNPKDYLEEDQAVYISIDAEWAGVYFEPIWDNPGLSIRCIYGFGIPRFRNTAVYNITTNSAELESFMINDGNDVNDVGFLLSTFPDPDIENHEQYLSVTNEPGGYGYEVSGLEPNTLYYVRPVAFNPDSGYGYGETIVFTTYNDILQDIEGNQYYTIVIDGIEWMAENLRTSIYSNGNEILTGLAGAEWAETDSGAYAIYDHTDWSADGIFTEHEMLMSYGALYNWYAVSDQRGICPAGWRVPDEGEYQHLIDNLWSSAGGALKSTRTQPDSHPRWNSPNYGATNESGFTALPAGYRWSAGGFFSLGDNAQFWSSTELDVNEASIMFVESYSEEAYQQNSPKNAGLSVRCIRDDDLVVEFGGGTGTELDPYIIATDEHLYNVRFAPNAHFRQEADIDLTESTYTAGDGWVPMAFGGTYDGNGHVIVGLFIERIESHQGLFSYAIGAAIYDLGLENIFVEGGTVVGGIVGSSENSQISNVHVTGEIYGDVIVGGIAGRSTGELALVSESSAIVNVSSFSGEDVGGMVGLNDNQAVVSGCYSLPYFVEGAVTGEFYVGGLVGRNGEGASVMNSYSMIDVSALAGAGGLVGYNSGLVFHSYSTGRVSGEVDFGGLIGITDWETGVVTNSYWDTDSSGRTASDGGTGRSTFNMVITENFMDWDFINIWSIIEEETYPFLQWENGPNQHNQPQFPPL